jgi:MFS family permease
MKARGELMSLKMIFSDRRYRPLFWTQFFGALNDNVFKNALVMMITYQGVKIGALDSGSIVALAGGIFILPFFLFSPMAGQISDRMEKSRLVRLTKIWEVAIMLVASIGFFTHQFEMLLVVLFGAGVQAALFGPVKYSLLPDLVKPSQLVPANAYVEMGTFLAILLGTIAGGLLVKFPSSEYTISISLMVVAILGLYAAWFTPEVPSVTPDLKVHFNLIPGLRSTHAILSKTKILYRSVMGISWFWFFGAAVLSILPVYCRDLLHADAGVVTCFLAMFTVGIGAGSVLCARLSPGRLNLRTVPAGALGLTVFLADLFFAVPHASADHLLSLSEFMSGFLGWRLMADFLFVSVSGGLFILPLYTLLQERSEPGERSRVIAGNNIVNAIFMVVASALVMGFRAWHFTYPQMFLTLALGNLAFTACLCFMEPEFLARAPAV